MREFSMLNKQQQIQDDDYSFSYAISSSASVMFFIVRS